MKNEMRKKKYVGKKCGKILKWQKFKVAKI